MTRDGSSAADGPFQPAAAATAGLGQTRPGVHPGGKFVAPGPSPGFDGPEAAKPWSRKTSIWERSAKMLFPFCDFSLTPDR